MMPSPNNGGMNTAGNDGTSEKGRLMIQAYAIVNDLGVMFRDHQLLVFPKKADAEKVRARLNIDEDGEFDGRVERVSIERLP
jgi:hypothetical protein